MSRRVALAVAVLVATWAPTVFAQAPTVVECNETADVTSTPRFDPPVRGPLTYQWRDATGRVVGSEAGLTVTLPVGQYIYTLVVAAENGRTATNRLTVLIRDTSRPGVGARTDLVVAPPSGAGADTLDVARAAGFAVTDLCDPRPMVTVSPTGPYPPGDTRVLLTATDVSGNSASVAVVMRVPPPAAPPRLGGAQGRPGAPSPPPGAPSVPPIRTAPAEPPGPSVAPGPPVSATPSEPVVPGTPPDPTSRPVSGASEPVQARPATNEPAQVPLATAPDSAPVILPPGAAEAPPATAPLQPPGGTDVAGFSWWWLVVPGGLLLAGLLLFARRPRDPVPPPLRATVRTRPDKDLGVQRLLLPPGVAQPRFEIRMRPRLDDAPQLVVGDTSVIEERRTHD